MKKNTVFVPSLGDFFSIVTGMSSALIALVKFSSPPSGTFFQYGKTVYTPFSGKWNVFVPSLGDFFSILEILMERSTFPMVFVPSLGDFFSIRNRRTQRQNGYQFSSPPSGTFFQFPE